MTALALLAREQVHFIITFDKNAIAAATDITRANPGLYTVLAWWQEALQPRWVYLVGTGRRRVGLVAAPASKSRGISGASSP